MFLLDYNQADTFIRATEAAFADPRSGWAFQAETEAANWKGINVLRLFGDGAVLIEAARENTMPESDLATWVVDGGASISADDATAPDEDTNADTVTFGASATDRVRHATTITSGAGSDATEALVSCWLRSTSGTETTRIGLRSKDGAAFLLSADLAVTTTWTRFEFSVADIGTGANSPEGVIQNATDAAARSDEAWGFQVEHLFKFKTSDVRTSGAAATRNKEILRYAAGNYPDRLATGRAKWSVWPSWSSATIIAESTAVHRVFSGNTSNEGLGFRQFGLQAEIAYFSSTGGVRVGVVGTWSADQKIDITMDFAADLMSVSGMTTGDVENKPFSMGSGSDIDPDLNTFTVGAFAAGGSTQQFDGVISRPVTA